MRFASSTSSSAVSSSKRRISFRKRPSASVVAPASSALLYWTCSGTSRPQSSWTSTPQLLDLLEHLGDSAVVEVQRLDQLADLGQLEALLRRARAPAGP